MPEVSLVEFLDRLFYQIVEPESIEPIAEMLAIMFDNSITSQGEDTAEKIYTFLDHMQCKF